MSDGVQHPLAAGQGLEALPGGRQGAGAAGVQVSAHLISCAVPTSHHDGAAGALTHFAR